MYIVILYIYLPIGGKLCSSSIEKSPMEAPITYAKKIIRYVK